MNQPLITHRQALALQELSDTLHANNISFVVIGGLAAMAWGAKRPLVDIDIQVGELDMEKTRSLFIKSLDTDTRHYVSEHWDITQMIINLHGVGIDICQADNFCVVTSNTREPVPNSIDSAVDKEVGGVLIPVMPKGELIGYKQKIGRPVDLEDIAFLEK